MLKEFLYQKIKKQPYGTEEIVPISKIIIPEEFKERRSKPATWKMIKARKEYYKHGYLDKPIVVDKNYILKNSYTRLLVGYEVGMKKVPIQFTK
jgi:hypothetical protein